MTALMADFGEGAVDPLQIGVNNPDLMALPTLQWRSPGPRPRWLYQHWR